MLKISLGAEANLLFFSSLFRFYYIDERLADGSPAYAKITGAGHADMTWELSQGTEQGDWRVRCVTSTVYSDFVRTIHAEPCPLHVVLSTVKARFDLIQVVNPQRRP